MNLCILEITSEESQVLLRVLSIVEKGLREFIDSSKTNKETRESGETKLATISNLKIKITDAGAKADISAGQANPQKPHYGGKKYKYTINLEGDEGGQIK